MVKEQEELCQKSLSFLLANEFPAANYAIGRYQEDAICLQKNPDTKWEVYTGYRNQHKNSVKHANVVEACLDMMNRLCIGDELTLYTLKDAFFDSIVANYNT